MPVDERLYTLRWTATKIASTTAEQSTKDLAQDQLKLINEMIGDKPAMEIPTSDLPKSTKGSTVIPFAVQAPKKMITRGKYQGGWPRGALVHFTNGHHEKGLQNALDCISLGITNRYTYHCIAYTGEIVQAHPADEWGYHAGESAWARGVAPLVGSVSDDIVGLEMCNPGKLVEKNGLLYPDYAVGVSAQAIKKENARYVTEEIYGCPTGWYLPYSKEQEATLVKTIFWYKDNDPTGRFSFDDVVGHHEVSGKLGIGYFRKSDPGGCLSMPMDKFREYLKAEYAKRG